MIISNIPSPREKLVNEINGEQLDGLDWTSFYLNNENNYSMDCLYIRFTVCQWNGPISSHYNTEVHDVFQRIFFIYEN